MSQEVPLSEIRVTKYPNTQRIPKYPISNRRHQLSSVNLSTRYWGYRNFLHIINNRLPEQSGALFQVVRLLSLLVAALRQVVHHSSFELLSGLGISSFVIVRYTTFGMETSSVTLNTTRSDMRPFDTPLIRASRGGDGAPPSSRKHPCGAPRQAWSGSAYGSGKQTTRGDHTGRGSASAPEENARTKRFIGYEPVR